MTAAAEAMIERACSRDPCALRSTDVASARLFLRAIRDALPQQQPKQQQKQQPKRRRIRPVVVLQQPTKALAVAEESAAAGAPDAMVAVSTQQQQRRLEALQRRACNPDAAPFIPRAELLRRAQAVGQAYATFVLSRRAPSLAAELALIVRLLQQQQQQQPRSEEGEEGQSASSKTLSPLLAFLGTTEGSTVFALAALRPLAHVVSGLGLLDPGTLDKLLGGCPDLRASSPTRVSSVPRLECSLCEKISVEPLGRLSHGVSQFFPQLCMWLTLPPLHPCTKERATLSEAIGTSKDMRVLQNQDRILDTFVEILRNAETPPETAPISAEVVAQLGAVALPENHPWLARLLISELQQRFLEESLLSHSAGTAFLNSESASKLRLLDARLTRSTQGRIGHSQPLNDIFEHLAGSASYSVVFHTISALAERIDELSALPSGRICRHMLHERVLLLRLLAKMLGSLVFAPTRSCKQSQPHWYAVAWTHFDPQAHLLASWTRGTLAVDLPWISEFLKGARGAVLPTEATSRLVSLLKTLYFSSALELSSQSSTTKTVVLALIEIENLLFLLGEDTSPLPSADAVDVPPHGPLFEIDSKFAQSCSTAMQDIGCVSHRGSSARKIAPFVLAGPSTNDDAATVRARELFWLRHPKLSDLGKAVAVSTADSAFHRSALNMLPVFESKLDRLLSECHPLERTAAANKLCTETVGCALAIATGICKDVVAQSLALLASPAEDADVISLASTLVSADAIRIAKPLLEKAFLQATKRRLQHPIQALCCCVPAVHFGLLGVACLVRVQHMHASLASSQACALHGAENRHKLPGILSLLERLLRKHDSTAHPADPTFLPSSSDALSFIESALAPGSTLADETLLHKACISLASEALRLLCSVDSAVRSIATSTLGRTDLCSTCCESLFSSGLFLSAT